MLRLSCRARLQANGPHFGFVDDPGKMPVDKVRTEIYAPIE